MITSCSTSSASVPDSMKSMRFEVCGIPYSIATPQSPGMDSSFTTRAIATNDSFHERTSERDTVFPVRCVNSVKMTCSMSRVKTSLRNRLLSL